MCRFWIISDGWMALGNVYEGKDEVKWLQRLGTVNMHIQDVLRC
jgi:hypothetical protein